MFPGQPAENSEKLRVGDIIMAANGVSLVGKTSRDAINVLRDQPTRVVLTVKRDPSSIPPGLLRRGSFSQSLDPNEVLSAIHSKLNDQSNSAFGCGPGDEKSPTREIRDSHGNDGSHASAFRKSSSAIGDESRMLLGKRELPQDSIRTNVDYYSNEDTSLDKSVVDMGSSEQPHGDNSRILNDEIPLSQEGSGINRGIYGHEDTSFDMNGIHRSNSGQQGNDLSSKTSTRNSLTNGSMSSDNYCQVFEPRAETVEMLGNSALVTSDEDVVSGSKFRERFSTGSLSNDEVVDDDRLQENLESSPLDSTLLSEQTPSPLESVVLSSQAGGGVREEKDKARNRRNSLGRPLENDKVEQLAPPEEVIVKSHFLILSIRTTFFGMSEKGRNISISHVTISQVGVSWS